MNYANQAGAAQDTKTAPREPSLNERLNRAYEGLQSSAERIERMLSRVNGTPQAEMSGGEKLAQIRPTLPLGQTVEQVEALSMRLRDLAINAERIA